MTDFIYLAFAAQKARAFLGNTSPNPAVGAALVKNEILLSTGAHSGAGTFHAEVEAIEAALKKHGAEALKGSTLYVTLEPCNHHGRTPPCTEIILKYGISKVVFSVPDLTKLPQQRGSDYLKAKGVEVVGGCELALCADLSFPFLKHAMTSKPWVVHKQAFRETSQGLTMVPEKGQKTFTKPESLKIAHIERKTCDAIITTQKTVDMDDPFFTVRLVEDFKHKQRQLVVLGKDAPNTAWVQRQKLLGFQVLEHTDFQAALADLSARGVHKIMVEAGLGFSRYLDNSELWDEKLIFITNENQSDLVFRKISEKSFIHEYLKKCGLKI